MRPEASEPAWRSDGGAMGRQASASQLAGRQAPLLCNSYLPINARPVWSYAMNRRRPGHFENELRARAGFSHFA